MMHQVIPKYKEHSLLGLMPVERQEGVFIVRNYLLEQIARAKFAIEKSIEELREFDLNYSSDLEAAKEAGVLPSDYVPGGILKQGTTCTHGKLIVEECVKCMEAHCAFDGNTQWLISGRIMDRKIPLC